MLGLAETKLLFYIAWRCAENGGRPEPISLTEFSSGMKDRYGSSLDGGTGLNRDTVITVLRALKERGLITATPGRNSHAATQYRLTLDDVAPT